MVPRLPKLVALLALSMLAASMIPTALGEHLEIYVSRNGNVVANISLSATFPIIPGSSVRWFEHLHHAWGACRSEVRSFFREAFEHYAHLHGAPMARVRIVNASLSFSYSYGYVSFAPTSAATPRGAGKIVRGGAWDLGSWDGVEQLVAESNASFGNLALLINFTLPSFVGPEELQNLSLEIVANLSAPLPQGGRAFVAILNQSGGLPVIVWNATDQLNTTVPRLVVFNASLSPEDATKALRNGRLSVVIVVVNPLEKTFLASFDMVRLRIRTIEAWLRISVVLNLSGVCEKVGNGTLRCNMSWRHASMYGDLNLSSTVVDPERDLGMNLSVFSKPLNEWIRVFNGTHTIFKLVLPSRARWIGGALAQVDPSAEIVVPGYATASGDDIVVRGAPPTTSTPPPGGSTSPNAVPILLGIAAVAIGIAIAFAVAKALKHVVDQAKRFVRPRT